MKWHLGIMAAAVLALAGCGGQGQGIQDTALRLVLNDREQSGTSVQARFQPLLQAKQGPALDVSVPKAGARGGFLRESKDGTIENWLGNDGVGLTFDRGLLVGTRGLGAGMLNSDVSASARAVLAGRSGQVQRVHTFLTGNDLAESRAFVCDIENKGTQTIQLDNGATTTRRMTETCRNPDQSFSNTYWVDTRRGRIVQSRQWSGEFVGDLVIQTVYNF